MQATVGSHCLECAKAARPDITTRVKYANARILTPITFALMGINVAVFVWMVLLDPSALSGSTEAHLDLALNRTIVHYTDEWYRILTSGFIHFGIIHLAFNMFILYQLGQLLERELGAARMLLCYLASLLGGSFGVLLLDGTAVRLTGGASGAVFGMMGVAAVGMHRRGVNILNTSLGSVLLLNLVLTFTMRNISIGGHIGGLVAGAICGWFVLAPAWKKVPAWARWGAPVAVSSVATLGCVWAVTSLAVFTG